MRKYEKQFLEEKSKFISLEIIMLVQEISSTKNFVIANQILRSGTSIGANIAESIYAVSKQNFIYRLQIAQKEANETKYWLTLLVESKLINRVKYNKLIDTVLEPLKILASSIMTAKQSNDY